MRNLRLDVLAAALALAAVTPAAANDCCPAGYVGCTCEPFYLLNQGPVFSGPGHDLPRQVSDAPPPAYPFVGIIYTGYPFGVETSGGYPRGMYSPFTGYPYVDPRFGRNAPSYVKYRMGDGRGRVHRRYPRM